MRWLLLLVLAAPLDGAFSHCRPITNTVQPSSSLTDFPTLWADTLVFMRTTGNGGELTSSSGYDMRIYPSPGCTGTPLAYSRESWSGTTGEFKIWIKHATLSTSATTLHVGTGDAGITTDQSDSSATFGVTGLISRYPFTDGTTLSVADTKGAHNGTATNMSAATGKINGGASWGDPPNSKVRLEESARIIADLANSTVSMWAKTSCTNTADNLYTERNPAQDIWKLHIICSSGKVAFVHRTSGSVLDLEVAQTTATVDDNAWHHIAIVKSGTSITIYVDGTSSGTATLTGNDVLNGGSTESAIGRDPQDATDAFSGVMDEVRIWNVTRSAAWIAHERENANNASYWTVGADQTGTTRRRVIITQ